MNFFWVLNGKKLKQTLLVIVAAFIAAGIAFVNTEGLPASSTGQSPQAISKVQTKKKQIALTFDIGWGELQVEPILKVLKEKGVQATFFVSGSWADHHPEIVKEMVKNKNEVGSHGFGHKNYRSMEKTNMRNDMLLSREAIKKATRGDSPSLLRPPDGSFNENVLRTAQALGFTVIDSSISSRDIENPGVEQIVKNVVKPASPGDIVLMHASDSAKQTAEALPIIIEKLRGKGYSLVTVSKLLNNADTRSNLVK